MSTKIFVNLPVRHLPTTVAFFTRLGFQFNSYFTDENATCMIVSEDIFVMLITENFFRSFTSKSIADASRSTEVILTLSADTRAAVDDLLDRACAAGAIIRDTPQDNEWMYLRGFQDPDGHLWEIAWMDMHALPQ
ncbi:VOC family protein [Chitinophaga lutea]